MITPALPSMSKGIKIRLTRKARVRTAARYSRTVMTQVLRTGRLPGPEARDAHEDFLKRRPCKLEMANLAALHEKGQDRLGIGAGRQA